MEKVTVGLFGTVGELDWRESILKELEDQEGLEIFNPFKKDWTPDDAKNEARHLASDRVLVFAITGEAFGVASLAELGIASGLVATSNRTLIAYMDMKCTAESSDSDRVKDSANARKIVKEHLEKMAEEREDIVLVDSLEALVPAILRIAGNYRKADSLQGMVRYGGDGKTVINSWEMERTMERNWHR